MVVVAEVALVIEVVSVDEEAVVEVLEVSSD